MFKIKPIIDHIRAMLPKRLSSKLPREIGVVLLKPEESAKLNMIYRNKNKATNVLSFNYGSDYGEILICPEIVKKEAKEAGNTQVFQMTWMMVHGMIHLSELHHEKSQVADGEFAKLEGKILSQIFKKKPRV
ncbi:MAG: rRNA maturation RNase YbeY [bacterium]|nr:rRNA maturation RNase YbeY [bacterium]